MSALHPLSAVTPYLSALRRFAQRHSWSLPLTLLASVGFIRLASEVQENELDAFDSAVAQGVTAFRGQLDGLMLALTWFGSARVMGVVAGCVALLLFLLRRAREALFLAICSLGALILNTTLKLFFQRARPDAMLDYLVQPPQSFSFPSGHAMCSMGVLASVAVVVRVVGAQRLTRTTALVVALLLVQGIALSRVYLGVHYPSDVIAGQLAGGAWVSLITGWFYPRLLPGEESGTTSDSSAS